MRERHRADGDLGCSHRETDMFRALVSQAHASSWAHVFVLRWYARYAGRRRACNSALGLANDVEALMAPPVMSAGH